METKTIKVADVSLYNQYIKMLFGCDFAYCGSFAWNLIGVLKRQPTDIDVILKYDTRDERDHLSNILLHLAKAYPSDHLSSMAEDQFHRAFCFNGITFDVWIKCDVPFRSLNDNQIVKPRQMIKNKLTLDRIKDWADFSEICGNIVSIYGSMRNFLVSY